MEKKKGPNGRRECQVGEIDSTALMSSGKLGSNTGGQILHLKLKNFMTYNSLNLYPTLGLNLIIGPNGSGKSSIISAICLVLGGKPSHTGRQIRIQDYIKHGCDVARIHIKLRGHKQDDIVTISRKIFLSGSSEYTINGARVREKDVEKEVFRFNIQVNNMCQFLPQEKVSEFAKMNPKQLLESMQQAVGDIHMYRAYEDLIQLRCKTRELEKAIKNKKTNIEKEKKHNEVLDPKIQRYEQREKCLEQIEIMKRKKPVLEYAQAQLKLVEQRRQKDAKSSAIRNYSSTVFDPLENEDNELQGTISDLESKISIKAKELEKSTNDEKSVIAQIKELDNQIVDENDSLSRKIQLDNERKEKIRQSEMVLAASQKQLEENIIKRDEMLAAVNATQDEYRACNEEYADLTSSIEQKKSSISTLHQQERYLNDEIVRLSNLEQKKLDSLKHTAPDSYEALIWLRNNRHRFKKHIYDPVLTLIDVPNTDNIRFIENHIAHKDMILFLCEDREDTKLLTNLLRGEKGWAINTAPVPNKPLSQFKSHISQNDLRQRYHFVAYIKDLFNAPDAVVQFLCENYNIHNTPVGNSGTENVMKSARLEDIPFRKYYTPEFVYTIKQSRYGNRNLSCSTTQLREKGILSATTNTSERQRSCEEGLMKTKEIIHSEEQELQKLEKQQNIVAEKLRHFRKQRDDCRGQKEKVNAEARQIEQRKDALRKAQSITIDVKAEIAKTNSAVNDRKNKKVVALAKLYSVNEKYFSIVKAKTKIRFQHYGYMKKRTLSEKRLNDAQTELNKLISEYRDAKRVYDSLKDHCKQLLKRAEQISGMPLATQEGRDQFIAVHGPLTESLEDFEREVERLKASVDLMSETDKSVIDEHTRRKETIAEEQKSLAECESDYNRLVSEIERKKAKWLDPLENLISKISSTFSKCFESLRCAGEISLNRSENQDDFDKYGLSIQVRFRNNASMTELSQAHHSGGECSVSTIIFILSLQELTDVPFRCVDEINQGMDSINERRIFDLVSQSAEKSSQYFLLTPKLLPDLQYSHEMKIHIIYNGPSLLFKGWNMLEMIKTANEQVSAQTEAEETGA